MTETEQRARELLDIAREPGISDEVAIEAIVVFAGRERAPLEAQISELRDRHAQTERDACMWAARAEEAERERDEALTDWETTERLGVPRVRLSVESLKQRARQLDETLVENNGMRARIAELEAALKPFAHLHCVFKGSDDDLPYDTPDAPDSFGLELCMATTEDGACDLTLGQIRRARAVFEASLTPRR